MRDRWLMNRAEVYGGVEDERGHLKAAQLPVAAARPQSWPAAGRVRWPSLGRRCWQAGRSRLRGRARAARLTRLTCWTGLARVAGLACAAGLAGLAGLADVIGPIGRIFFPRPSAGRRGCGWACHLRRILSVSSGASLRKISRGARTSAAAEYTLTSAARRPSSAIRPHRTQCGVSYEPASAGTSTQNHPRRSPS